MHSAAGTWLFAGRRWLQPHDPDDHSTLLVNYENLHALFPHMAPCSLDRFLHVLSDVTEAWGRRLQDSGTSSCDSLANHGPRQPPGRFGLARTRTRTSPLPGPPLPAVPSHPPPTRPSGRPPLPPTSSPPSWFYAAGSDSREQHQTSQCQRRPVRISRAPFPSAIVSPRGLHIEYGTFASIPSASVLPD